MISGVRASSIRIEFDLVDDGKDVSALDHVLLVDLHVVAQVVEAELVVGAVGHVAGILCLALLVVEVVHDAADGEPQERVDLAHPLCVAMSQIIVDGDDVHALAGERVEVDGERRDERLALASLHLRDLAVVQDHAADELHVEVALPQRSFGRLADGRERRHEEIVERCPMLELEAKLLRARLQLRVAELGDLGLERIYRLHAGPVAPDAALVRGAEDFCREAANRGEHHNVSLNCQRVAAGHGGQAVKVARVNSRHIRRRCLQGSP